MLISIFFLLHVCQLIDPETRWQVPFFPVELAALNHNGQILLATPSELYLYDTGGNLLLTKPTDVSFSLVTHDPLGQFWAIDDDGRLACYDETLTRKWRRNMPQPLIPPQIFGANMAYVSAHFIQILDPISGTTQVGRYFPVGIIDIQLLSPYLVMTHEDHTSQSWLPGARIQPHHPLAVEPLRFVSPGPKGRLAVLLPKNVLRVYDPKGRVDWERQFNLDVSFAPLWLGSDENPFLAIITQGRSIFIYQKNGQGANRFNMHDRPRALIQCSDSVFLVALQAEKQVIWYFHDQRQFVAQSRSNHLTHLLQNDDHVLLIDYDGQVEVYRRERFSVSRSNTENPQ